MQTLWTQSTNCLATGGDMFVYVLFHVVWRLGRTADRWNERTTDSDISCSYSPTIHPNIGCKTRMIVVHNERLKHDDIQLQPYCMFDYRFGFVGLNVSTSDR